LLVTIQPAKQATDGADGPAVHLFETEFGNHAYLPNGSRVFTVPLDVARRLQTAVSAGDQERILERLGLKVAPYITNEPLASPPVRALSLAVAQKCNLACTYCYAGEGTFGGNPEEMSLDVALSAVRLLFSEAGAGERVSLAFLGGEPLTNRRVLRKATEYAETLAMQRAVRLGLAITTNGTLLNLDDADFFEDHGFAVTISLDGLGKDHDRLRPFKSGAPSFERVIERSGPLLRRQQRMQVSARATVTPRNLDLLNTLKQLLSLGFHSVGFSPLLHSSGHESEMDSKQLEQMLEAMIACAGEFEREMLANRRFAFLNIVNALQEIHRGTHRPYPCGAGAGYFGVSARGELFACHRFVEDRKAHFGDVESGVNRGMQNTWLEQRHVHFQHPCKGCWARYLCGGGCHHEVLGRGRPACDYIRGWLDHCLKVYLRIIELRPQYFGEAPSV
jgi:uncharacterized protein